MKYLLLLFCLSILMSSCANSEESEKDCGCVKTNYRGYFRTSSSNSYTVEKRGSENVPCQDVESQVTTQAAPGGDGNLFYVICCDHLEGGKSKYCR